MSREQIVRAAITLLDKEGIDALTIRRLARELDVEPPALYWHFSSKDEICRGVVAEISAQLHVEASGTGNPREQLHQHLTAIRAHWQRHPSALELGRRFPPTVDDKITRSGIDLLLALGVPSDQAVDRYRVLTWSVMGFVIVEHALPGSVHHHRDDPTSSRWILKLAGSSTAPSEFDTEALFQTTIGLLLDAIELAITTADSDA